MSARVKQTQNKFDLMTVDQLDSVGKINSEAVRFEKLITQNLFEGKILHLLRINTFEECVTLNNGKTSSGGY